MGTNVAGTLLIADGTDFSPVAMSGDVAITGAGVTDIATNAVDGTEISVTGEAAGSVMYFDGTNWLGLAAGTSGKFLKSNAAGAPAWDDVTSASVAWDTIGDPTSAAPIGMNEYAQTMDWNTALTAAGFTGLDLTITNDASTQDITVQRVLALTNKSATGGTTENLLYLDNADNSAVTAGI